MDDASEQVVRGVQGLCDLINSEDGITRIQITTILTNAFLLSGMLNPVAIFGVMIVLNDKGRLYK